MENEGQRDAVTCPGSHDATAAELALGPWSLTPSSTLGSFPLTPCYVTHDWKRVFPSFALTAQYNSQILIRNGRSGSESIGIDLWDSDHQGLLLTLFLCVYYSLAFILLLLRTLYQ